MNSAAQPIRILLVDDSFAFLWGLRKLIEAEYPRLAVVGAVATADEALVYCDLEPHVTLLDVDLRGASSLGFIPEIRARSHGEVLALTGLRDPRVHEQALRLGALRVLTKDLPGAELLQAVEQAARGRGDGSIVLRKSGGSSDVPPKAKP
jgi:DNA-binding NarL/FixJ family response regulator